MKYIWYKVIALIVASVLLFSFVQKENIVEIILFLESSKDIELQFFYSDEENIEFNEEKSIKILVPKANKIEKISTNLKLKKLEKLRIDFGEFPEKLKVKELKIKGNKIVSIKSEELLNSTMNQIDNKSIIDDILVFESNLLDPFIVIENEKLKIDGYIAYDFLQCFIFFIILYFLIYKILLYLKCKKKGTNWINLIFIFCIYFAFLFPIFKIDNYEKDMIENRALAKKPNLIMDGNLNWNFGKEVENWLNDHFYKRDIIINYYKKFIQLISGKVENESAMLGKENWIFYKGDNSISNFQNDNLYSQKDLERIGTILLNRKNWMEKRGIKYYIFIAPDKNKIYSEFYPSYIKKINNIGKAQQLKEYFEETNDFNIIYPYDELMGEKEVLYWKTDTHWNEYGAFVGYSAIMKKIKFDFPEIKIQKESDYLKKQETYLVGDLLSMLGINGDRYLDEKYYRFTPINGYSFSFLKISNDYNKFIPDKNFNFYSMLGPKMGAHTTITSSHKPLKVLFFHDSFGISMVPYLSETFGYIEYISTKNLNDFQEKIISEKPDIVIHELVERYIYTLENNEPKLREVN